MRQRKDRKIHKCATQVAPLGREDPHAQKGGSGPGYDWRRKDWSMGENPGHWLSELTSVGISHYPAQKGHTPTLI